MRLKRNIAFGVRQQASSSLLPQRCHGCQCVSPLVSVAICPECLGSHIGGLSDSGCRIRLCPIVALVFTGSLWWTYLRSTREYGGWVSAATLAVIHPTTCACDNYDGNMIRATSRCTRTAAHAVRLGCAGIIKTLDALPTPGSGGGRGSAPFATPHHEDHRFIAAMCFVQMLLRGCGY